MTYKVEKEEGVTVDGVEFAKGEIIDLDSDAFNIPELVADGSIVETEVNDDDGANDGADEPGDVPPGEGTHQPEDGSQ